MMSFTLFARLPAELQDQIWEASIPGPPKRTAHFAQLNPVTDAIEDTSSLTRTRSLPITGYKGLSRSNALHTLLQTTRRSRAAALRHIGLGKTTTNTTIATAQAMEPCLNLRGANLPIAYKSAARRLPSLKINTETDLVILESGWYPTLRRFSYGQIPAIIYTGSLRYVAVDRTSWLRGSHISKILRGFKDIHIFYLLIPEHKFTSTGDAASYVEGEGRPDGFWFGRREYYEITREAVARLSGWGKAIHDAMAAFANEEVFGIPQAEGGVPKKIRLMSWRDT